MTDYPELRESLKSLAGSVDHDAAWDQIRQRATRRRPLVSFWDRTTSRLAALRRNSPSFDEAASTAPVAERIGDEKRVFAPKPSAPRRRNGPRIAVYASIAVVLVAAITVGSLEAVQHLGKDQPIVVITDDTIGISPGSTGQSTPTTAAETAALQGGSWEQLPLTSEGGVVRILVMDPSDSSILYAAVASSGLFKSTDGAESWERLPLDEGDVWLIGVDPTSPSTVYVYAGDYSEPTLCRSDDGGVSWTELTAAPAPFVYNLPDLSFDPSSTPSTLYTWSNDYAARSTDRGETWTIVSGSEGGPFTADLPATAVGAFEQSLSSTAQQALDAFRAPFEATGSTVTVTDSGTGLAIQAGMSRWTLRVDPNDSSIFYLGTDEGVYKSLDGGKTWRKSSAGLTSSAVGWVVPDPSSASTLYAGASEGLFKSDDGGETWRLSLSGGSAPVIAPSSPSTLYATTPEGLFRSTEGGDTWTRQAGEVVGASSSSEYHLSDPFLVAADDPDIVFAMGGSSTVDDYPRWLFRSTDGGDTWSPVLGGDTPVEERDQDFVESVVADPEDPSTMYAERQLQPPEDPDFSNVLLRSTDTGATWTVVSPQQWVADHATIVGITVDPRAPTTVYVLRYLTPLSTTGVSPLLVRSRDGGTTWEEVQVPASRWGNLPLFDPRSPDTLYVQADDGLYRSTDEGATWLNMTAGEVSVMQRIDFMIDPAPGGGLYAAADNGLYEWMPSDK